MHHAPWMIYSLSPERAFALQVNRLALTDLSHAELLALADHLTHRVAIQDQLLSQAVGRVMDLECVLEAGLQQQQLGN